MKGFSWLMVSKTSFCFGLVIGHQVGEWVAEQSCSPKAAWKEGDREMDGRAEREGRRSSWRKRMKRREGDKSKLFINCPRRDTCHFGSNLLAQGTK